LAGSSWKKKKKYAGEVTSTSGSNLTFPLNNSCKWKNEMALKN
jgi:hypothetical protein